MTASAPKPPTPVDPQRIIDAQSQANRINRITPFGSQTYGPNGLTTTVTPGMQGVIDNQTSLASQPYHLLQPAQGQSNLQNEIMNKVSNHYAQPSGQKPSAGQQMPPIGNINGQQSNPAMQAMIQKIWGQLP